MRAKRDGRLIDLTFGRRARAAVFLDSNHVAIVAIAPDTLVTRLAPSDHGPRRSVSGRPIFVLISYDVASTKRRTKIHDALLDYGTRVQFSVFECVTDAEALAELRERLQALMHEQHDSIRIYRLCEMDVKKIRVLGPGGITRREPFRIV